MANKTTWWVSGLGIAVVGLAGFAVFRWQQRGGQDFCYHSWLEIQPGVLTVGEVEGKAERFCCPACALTTARQTGKPVRVLRLTDFTTHQPLEPKTAFLVRGSDVQLCSHPHPMIVEDKQAVPIHFDRCLPSIVAFGSRDTAEAFRREHGGELLQMADLAPHLTVP